MHRLNDHEGIFLSLVRRLQPTTAYQVAKVYERSPVTNYKTHKGKIYPIIARLEARGLLEKRQVAGDRRGTEEISCTTAGEGALREWVMHDDPSHLLIDDPLRMKVQTFDLLSDAERLTWISTTRDLLLRKLAEVEDYGRSVDLPFKDFVHDNAVRSIRTRMDWLDSLMADLAGPARARE
jgi:DNA-binding PadR family transcriptional regulator